MRLAKFLHSCWIFIKKMNQNENITINSLLTDLNTLPNCRSLHGTLLYRMMFEDKFSKFKPYFSYFDNHLIKRTTEKRLPFHINRLKIMLKYGLPIDSSLEELIPLLTTSISRNDLINLCNCL